MLKRKTFFSFIAVFLSLLWVGGNFVYAATSTLTTNAATSITTTSATISATITSNGGAVIQAGGFEYGLTAGYGSTTSDEVDYAFERNIGTSSTGPSQFNLNSNDNIAGGIAIDSSNSIYVTDMSGSGRIQVFNSSGTYLSEFANCFGGNDEEEACYAAAVHVDSSDNVIFTGNNGNTGYNSVKKYDSTHTFSTYVGTYIGGAGTAEGEFSYPGDVTMDSLGNIYVVDTLNNRVQKFDSSGNFTEMIGWGVETGGAQFEVCTSGCQAGIAGTGDGQFDSPTGIVFDSSDNMFVVDSVNNRVQKFNSAGVYQSQFGSTGTGNGQFDTPKNIDLDSSGNIFVTDGVNNRVQKFNSAGVYQSQFGSTGTGNGQFNLPHYLEIDASNNIYVSDTNNSRIQKFDSSGTYLLQFGSSGTGNGELSIPNGIAADSTNNIYVIDTNNNRIQKFDSSGTYLSKFTYSSSFTSSGGDSFYNDLNINSLGEILISNVITYTIDIYDALGAYQSQFGSVGTGNGQFSTPLGVGLDQTDNIYVVDSLIAGRVQKFNSAGVYQSQFGSVGTGNGQFSKPTYIDLDSSGNIFVSDSDNNRIQKFNSSGVYQSQFGSLGNGNGEFDFTGGLDTDSLGNTYVVDVGNDRIQKFDSLGVYQSSLGTSGRDEGEFSSPQDLVIDADDNIYVSDTTNNLILKFSQFEFSADLTGLVCGQTYHYRAFATNADGAGYGSDQTFDTSSCPGGGGGGGGGDGPDEGCTDPTATNYDDNADDDDGSCQYDPVVGCMDNVALNYDSLATISGGVCIYPAIYYGCTDTEANNFDDDAVINDGSCEYDDPVGVTDISGCMDADATNYNPSATLADGSCSYIDIPIDTDPPSGPGPSNPSNPGSGGGSNGGSFNPPKEILDVLVPVGLAIPLLVTLIQNSGLVASALSIPIRIWTIIPTLMGYKRRKRPWGTVYDSVTKQPLDPVYVTLFGADKKEVTTSITDIDGRYGFFVPTGIYSMSANKANYKFPSEKMTGKTSDELYDNLYFGGDVEVKGKEEVINKNIPMDAINFNWNEFEKSKNKNLMKFYSSMDLFFGRTAKILFVAGLLSSIFLSIFAPSVLNWVFLGIYGVIIILAFFGIKPRASGYIFERSNGYPLSFGILRVFSAELNREVGHTVIGKTGKYFILVPKGRYYMKIQKKTGEDSYVDIYRSESFRAKNGYINKIIKI